MAFLQSLELGALVQVLQDAPVGALVVERSKPVVLYANRSLESMLGYESQGLRQVPLTNLIPQQARSRHDEWMRAYFQDPHARPMGGTQTLYALHRDGQTVPVEIALAPQIVDGRPCVVAYVSNISSVARLQRRLERVLSVLPLGVLIVDEGGTIRECNPALEEQFGYAVGSLVGQSLEKLLPQRLHAVHKEHVAGYQRDPTPRRMGVGRDLTALHRTGVEFPVEVALSSVDTEEGRQLIAVVSDITARKGAEDTLRQINAQLEEFTYVASHDLRSPLRGIADLFTWIKEDIPAEQMTPSIAQNLERVQVRIERCERMIDDLLDYARAGQRDSKTAMVDLGELVEEIAGTIQVPQGFEIVRRLDAAPFQGHRTPLGICLRNLLDNAIKHHGGEQGRIAVSAADLGRFLVLSVEDDGQGIPESAYQRVFKLFHRATAASQGHGVGLALTRRIVNAHGGSIVLERSSGLGGACFRIHWPRVAMKGVQDD